MKLHRLKMYQEFNMPVAELWVVLSDHARFGQILGQKITRIKDSADADDVNGVNSVRKIHVPLIPFEETILQSEKPNLIVYTITKNSPLAHHLGTMRIKDLGNGRSALEYDIEMGSNIPLFGWLVKIILANSIGGRLRKFAKSRQ